MPRIGSIRRVALASCLAGLLWSGCQGGDPNKTEDVPGVKEEVPGVEPDGSRPPTSETGNSEGGPTTAEPEVPGVEPMPTEAPKPSWGSESLVLAVATERAALLAGRGTDADSRLQALDSLPDDECEAAEALASYDWVSSDAAAHFKAALHEACPT